MKTNVVLFKARIKSAHAKNLNQTSLQTLMGVSLDGCRVAIQVDPTKDSKRVICYAYARPSGAIKIGKKGVRLGRRDGKRGVMTKKQPFLDWRA